MMYCDKHNDASLHKPLYESKSGGYFCPNVERTSEDGKPIYCSFKVAATYGSEQRSTSQPGSPQRRIDGGKAAGVNSIIRGWASAGVEISDEKIKEAIRIVNRTDFLLTQVEEEKVEVI